jgi:hypothetical protein
VLLFYALAGARADEGAGVDGRHPDLASHPGMVHIGGTKSSARDRKVPLLRDALIDYRADFRFGARDPMLSTRGLRGCFVAADGGCCTEVARPREASRSPPRTGSRRAEKCSVCRNKLESG